MVIKGHELLLISPHPPPLLSITPSAPPLRFPSSFLGSHWEQRLLRDDLMSSTIVSHDAYLSAPTLALFEDSGWYAYNCTRCVVLFPGHRLPATVGSASVHDSRPSIHLMRRRTRKQQ